MIIAKISILKVLKNLTLLHKFNLAMEKSKNTRYSNLSEKLESKNLVRKPIGLCEKGSLIKIYHVFHH